MNLRKTLPLSLGLCGLAFCVGSFSGEQSRSNGTMAADASSGARGNETENSLQKRYEDVVSQFGPKHPMAKHLQRQLASSASLAERAEAVKDPAAKEVIQGLLKELHRLETRIAELEDDASVRPRPAQ